MAGRILTLAVLSAAMSGVAALTVTIPQEVYEFARGDNITIPCSFKTAQTGTPPLIIISWSVEGVAAGAKEILILTYYSNPERTDIKSVFEGRVALDVDTRTGKANLKLSRITLADNKLFECRVQIPGDDEGKPAATSRLVVLVAPSKPLCAIEGKAEYGQNINLTCRSEEGSPPPTYQWESRDVRNMPRVPDPRTTDKGGVLALYNISKETSGFYICTSRNKIREATCNVTLAVMPPSMNFGSTAIIIAVVAAVLSVLAIVIFCCCRHHKKKKQEQQAYAMGTRGEEYVDKEEPPRNGESRRPDGEEDAGRDRYEERSEPANDSRRDYDDRRSDYDDRRSDYDDRRSDYDDRRSDYTDRRRDYDDDRRRDYEDDRRNRDGDRYDEPYDDRARDRPPVPNSKPPYDD